MMPLARQAPPVTTPHRSRYATATLAAAVLGFFMVTLDAVVVNVALPSIRADLGGGITGLQWVVDGCTLLSSTSPAVSGTGTAPHPATS